MSYAHDCSRRHQRLRPHRPQPLPGRHAAWRRHRLRRRQRPRVAGHDGPPPEVRLAPRDPPAEDHGHEERHQGRRRRAARAVRAQPDGPAVGGARRRHRRRVDRPLHVPGQGRRPPRRRRAARGRVGALRRRRRHVRDGRQPSGLRPEVARGRVQRQLHDQLLRADGQGARRRVRHRAGPDDHDPRLHRRPDARRRPAQGPPPGPRRGDQHRADEHGRRPFDIARPGGDEGQARRHVAARAGADRLDHRLQRHPRQPRPPSPRSTAPSPRPPSPDR